ncbi:hypothetical protein ABC974_18080 [Sphingomonas oligophenolica]|uniref:Peptidase C80 domain-containing protein n=1 Tax=Sphingomonas oligophenolica TaxID=301154 RepID=A0ABU9Y6Z1_9SPHN
MAASDPEGFAKQDLRLYRDQMPPAEYDALDRAQKAWGAYPPGAHGVTQQRALEKVRASGLDAGAGGAIASQYEDATGSSRSTQPPPTDEEVDRLANIGTIPAALRGADATKATVRAMLLRGWTSDQIQNQLYDSYVTSHLRHGLESPGESIGPEADTGEPDHAASGEQVETIGNSPGMSTAAHLMPVNYGTGKRRATKPKPSALSDEIPEWLQKQRRSILRSPIYVSSSDQDVYYAVRRMGNPDGWTIIYTHGAVNRDGKVYDQSRGIPHKEMPAIKIFEQLRNLPGYDPRAKILLTACYAANDTTARDLSAITHGVVYAAKGYVSEPSVRKNIYRLTVNNQYGQITGYAKFVNGVEVPSELLSVNYDTKTHSWNSVILKKPAPVGDRSPSPGKEPWLWRMFH